jgi:hypothetical protein
MSWESVDARRCRSRYAKLYCKLQLETGATLTQASIWASFLDEGNLLVQQLAAAAPADQDIVALFLALWGNNSHMTIEP